jgi:hypothetical protein
MCADDMLVSGIDEMPHGLARRTVQGLPTTLGADSAPAERLAENSISARALGGGASGACPLGATTLERNMRLHVPGSALPSSAPRVLRAKGVPPAPARALQRLMAKAGRLDWEQRWLDELVRARS